MGKCRVCPEKGLFLKRDKYGLCPRCSRYLQMAMKIPKDVLHIAAGNAEIIEAVDMKIARQCQAFVFIQDRIYNDIMRRGTEGLEEIVITVYDQYEANDPKEVTQNIKVRMDALQLSRCKGWDEQMEFIEPVTKELDVYVNYLIATQLVLEDMIGTDIINALGERLTIS